MQMKDTNKQGKMIEEQYFDKICEKRDIKNIAFKDHMIIIHLIE